MKTMLAIAIAGFAFGAPATSMIAQAAGLNEVGWERYGVTGLMGALLIYLVTKFVPQLLKDARESAEKMQATFATALDKLASDHKAAAQIVATEAKAEAVEVAKHNSAANLSLCGKIDDLIAASKETTSAITASGDSQLAVLRLAVLEKKKASDA
jgi:hypothetical protein